MGKGSFVILGNGGAAIFAARAARTSGYTGEIHLVSDVDAPAFNPMLFPYYFKGKILWDGCFPFGAGFYRDHNITCHFGVPVESLDARSQRVSLAGGRTLPYDRCLIATGAAPAIPPVPGLRGSPRAFPLRTAASAKKLEGAMRTARRAVVLGASLVGMKMAEILVKKGIQVVLLDVVDQVLPRGTHPSAAVILMHHLERHGIDVRLGCTMEGMEGVKEGVVCHFTGDVIEAADIVVVCTGVRPNLAFVDRGQVKVELAVLTDERMRTSAENLYAAGDVSQGLNLVSGKHEWLGTWGSACYQGRTVGQRISGKESVYPGTLPENISPFFEWNYAQLGEIQPQGGDVRHIGFGDPEKDGYCLLAFQNGLLAGANLINCTHYAGKLRRVILQKWHCNKVRNRETGVFTQAVAEEILTDCMAGIWQFPRQEASTVIQKIEKLGLKQSDTVRTGVARCFAISGAATCSEIISVFCILHC
jgi:NADPH-dependent 2,4-dienoyl-CoA reductase/sulfur reductase-like enzyme